MWNLGSGVVRLVDGRPIGGLIDVAIAVFFVALMAGNHGWGRLRVAGLIQGGALVSIAALLFTHVVLADASPLAVALLLPLLPLFGGVALGFWYWDLTRPERLLPPGVAERAQQLPGADWSVVKATVVLEDGRRARNVRILRGRIASRAAVALFDPGEVVDVLPEPSKARC